MKHVAPSDESAIPSRTYTLDNGDWRCVKCGQPISARAGEKKGHWHVGMPGECEAPQLCADRSATLADSFYDPAHACLPPN